MSLPAHLQHHHHDPEDAHPAAALAPSLLRMGALERLLIAALLSTLLWAVAAWAMM